MKQKYTLIRDDEKQKLILQEHAELDKDTLSLLCEQIYEAETLRAAIEKGPESVKEALKTLNIYPPGPYLERLAEEVTLLYGASEAGVQEVFFDDSELLIAEEEEEEETPDEDADIDNLLEDDSMEEDFVDDDNATISNIGANASLKIADDDSLDVDDEG